MVRVTNAVAYKKKKKRLFQLSKGFVGDRKDHYRQTSCTVMRALAFNYMHRKQNKRNFRALWIGRIGVASKIHGINYNKLIEGLKKIGCELNRKILADLAIRDPNGFKIVADTVKAAF